MNFLMSQPEVIPLWFQIHAKLPNPSSINNNIVDPWNPEKEDIWIRSKNNVSIKDINWDVSGVGKSKMSKTEPIKMYGFVSLIKCMEELFKEHKGNVAQLVGLRSDESLDRFRAVSKHPAIDGVLWSTKRKHSVNFYPIYDWRFSDVWTYLGKNNLDYNKIYDLFYWKGMNPNKMRLANLIHTKSYECLRLIQEFEPETVDKLLDRIDGLATAQEYAGRGGGVFSVKELPKEFKNWVEYRDYLLDTLPNQEFSEKFRKRFKNHHSNDYVVKQQVNRILITDVNGYKPISNKEFDPTIKIREKWMQEL